ncbi:hypothetical protein LguiA_019505 [Lonicera macranthoides]
MRVFITLLLTTCLLPSIALAEDATGVTRHYKFDIKLQNVTRLRHTKSTVTVNREFPGPWIMAREGDRLVIQVLNHVQNKISIHWHGIRQLQSGWADGPAYISQCPIQTGQSYAYNFTVVGQRGTFFWHAHISWLRPTLYGPLVILPKPGVPYPFPKPNQEAPIIFGEWIVENDWLKPLISHGEIVELNMVGDNIVTTCADRLAWLVPWASRSVSWARPECRQAQQLVSEAMVDPRTYETVPLDLVEPMVELDSEKPGVESLQLTYTRGAAIKVVVQVPRVRSKWRAGPVLVQGGAKVDCFDPSGLEGPVGAPGPTRVPAGTTWFNTDTEAIINQALQEGGGPNVSNAYTINGLPGPLYNCSAKDTFKLRVKPGKTYPLRLINTALNDELFFSIANHTLEIVDADVNYVKPFKTDTLTITPGQTTNVLLKTKPHFPNTTFLMMARPYATGQGTFDNSTVAALLEYKSPSKSHTKNLPLFKPTLPPLNDTSFATNFRQSNGVYSPTFLIYPINWFNYTGNPPNNTMVSNGTKLTVLPYNISVELVMQDTSILGAESHPLYLHGFNFFIIGQGFGNYDAKKDPENFNLADPIERNTVGVHSSGWVAIHFLADNPSEYLTCL